MLCKLNDMFKRIKEKIKEKKASAEMVAFVLLLLFVILAIAPKVKDIGSTMSEGIEQLNNDLDAELNN